MPQFYGPNLDTQANGWAAYGTEHSAESGYVWVKQTRFAAVPVPCETLATKTIATGSATVTFVTSGAEGNEDGTGTAYTLVVPAGINNGARVQTEIWGRVVGIRYVRNSATPPFSVSVDGEAFTVPAAYQRPTFWGQPMTGIVDRQALWIVKDDLPPGPHSVEVYLPADVSSGGSSRTLLVLGWIVDSGSGYSPVLHRRLPITTMALTTSAQALIFSSGGAYNTVAFLNSIWFVNTTAGAITVTMRNGSTIVWGMILAASASFVLEMGGPTALTTAYTLTASAVGVNATIFGGL